jgi:hypothetical protein
MRFMLTWSVRPDTNRWTFSIEKLALLATLATLTIPIVALGQSALDGTWKADMQKSSFDPKPIVFVLADGMYDCTTCEPPYKVKADGTDQPVTGSPYFDTAAIKVVNNHEIEETDKKEGKIVSTATTIVSADGKTATFTFSDSSNTNGGPPVTGTVKTTRVADGPAGSLAVSGSWRMAKVESLSDNGIVWTYKVSGEEVTMTDSTGHSYTAKLDGTDAPMKGDPGVTSVSVKMLDKNTLQETDKRDGKVTGVWTMTVSADGKTAKAISEDKLADRKAEFAVTKQ